MVMRKIFIAFTRAVPGFTWITNISSRQKKNIQMYDYPDSVILFL